MRFVVKGGGQFFQVAQRGVAEGGANLLKCRLGTAKEVSSGQRLQELAAQVKGGGLFKREPKLRQPGAAIELPLLAAVIARLIDQRKPQVTQETQIALDGLLRNVCVRCQFTKRCPQAAGP